VKAALLRGPRDVILEEISEPEISDDEVLVEVKYCGICGSDVQAFKEGELFPPGTYLGHEFSGVLSRVGKNVARWKVGDRVVIFPSYRCGTCWACRHGLFSSCPEGTSKGIGSGPGKESAGGFAKLVRILRPDYRLYALPDEVSFEEGTLIEPLACSLHAVRKSMFKPGDKVAVLGCGTMGLGAIVHLRNAGANLIMATEINERRAEVARKLGANWVFNPQKTADIAEKVIELTGGIGVDVVFDASGVPQAFQSAVNFLRPGGQILLLGVITAEVSITPVNFNVGEKSLQGSIECVDDEYPVVIDFLKRGISPVKEMITSKIKLSDIVEDGFSRLIKPGGDDIKIIVEPD
jgi:(R,R)-butanediol dehydrogenase/meso-butanediol dehydrogenase/diacetyl reductase